MTNGAIMAPQDWVEKMEAVSEPEACKLLARKVPNVTNHEPQIKNSRNIITDNLIRIVVFIGFKLVNINGLIVFIFKLILKK
jgi:hypothetical protein